MPDLPVSGQNPIHEVTSSETSGQKKQLIHTLSAFRSHGYHRFFASRVQVPHRAASVWSLLRDLGNIHFWHPHMYHCSRSNDNGLDLSHYINRYVNEDYGLKKICVLERDDHLTSLLATVLPLDAEPPGVNHFRFKVTAGDDHAMIDFERYYDFSRPRMPQKQFKLLVDIATDITYRLLHIEYDDLVQ